MKKPIKTKRLKISADTLRVLTQDDLDRAAGGVTLLCTLTGPDGSNCGFVCATGMKC